ncbi:hypothetical protein [uncultured Bacteroides sp.]|uniref:hypothetical protein n=1 Tax=uncultured Bacteroides sp. TaxID=162156 RepID=UPI0023D338F6|nr:hypothetical protein [uncultured Bacteroides sp.]MDE5701350.1 hypothetical protein [Bacteroides sp.]
MKKVLLLSFFFVLFSCTSDNEEWDNVNISPVTRTESDASEYFFELYNNTTTYRFDFLGKSLNSLPYITTYKTDSTSEEGYKDVSFDVISKPEWVDSIINATIYEKIRIAMPLFTKTESTEEKTGRIVLRQKESNKTLYYDVVQGSYLNRIRVSVKNTNPNGYEFTATAKYPVKDEVRVRVPFEVYNDGGKLDHGALMVIPKGGQTGTYLMDFNASPLVYYHGDLKGYNLFEGSIIGDDVYTYEFYRYW